MALSLLVFAVNGCHPFPPTMDGGYDHVMLVFVGQDECVGYPQVLDVRRGDFIRFYMTEDGPGSVDFRFTEPGDPVHRNPLTDEEDLSFDGRELSPRVRVSKNADKGEYKIKLQCGGLVDDPPKVRVW